MQPIPASILCVNEEPRVQALKNPPSAEIAGNAAVLMNVPEFDALTSRGACPETAIDTLGARWDLRTEVVTLLVSRGSHSFIDRMRNFGPGLLEEPVRVRISRS
jgi:hypothetical protein